MTVKTCRKKMAAAMAVYRLHRSYRLGRPAYDLALQLLGPGACTASPPTAFDGPADATASLRRFPTLSDVLAATAGDVARWWQDPERLPAAVLARTHNTLTAFQAALSASAPAVRYRTATTGATAKTAALPALAYAKAACTLLLNPNCQPAFLTIYGHWLNTSPAGQAIAPALAALATEQPLMAALAKLAPDAAAWWLSATASLPVPYPLPDTLKLLGNHFSPTVTQQWTTVADQWCRTRGEPSLDRSLATVADWLESLHEEADTEVQWNLAPQASVTTSTAEPASPTATGREPRAVDVGTIHATKGLEWEHVWVLASDLELDRARADPEESRVLFVALTRARRSVNVMQWPDQPTRRRH